MVSGQCTWYQNETPVALAGSVNVCASELSVVGEVLPTMAEPVPECAVLLAEVDPVAVQPVRPDSKLGLVRLPPPPPPLLQFVPQQMLKTECSSMPFGATPVWPCRRSKKPTPVTVTVSLTVWNDVVTAYFASKALRALVICEDQ